MPAYQKAPYLRIISALKPHKSKPKRIRFTIGGNRIDYKGKVSTPTSDLTTVKILLNSLVSTPIAHFMTIDINDFYLNTPMNRYDYMHILVKDTPASIMAQNKLEGLVHNGHVLVEIYKRQCHAPNQHSHIHGILSKPLQFRPTMPVSPASLRTSR
jgi:hypothetical protein